VTKQTMAAAACYSLKRRTGILVDNQLIRVPSPNRTHGA
jgi:hypothetical protein